MKKILFSILALMMIGCSRSSETIKDANPEGNQIKPKTGNYSFSRMDLIKDKLIFNTIAVGRETKLGADDGPTVQLTDNGFCHPSVIYIPGGFNGYKYWCALTPRFGVIMKQPDIDAYENPHIFRSNDGINWQEPESIRNPVDKAIKGPYGNYWSDTNLLYTNNKLYLYYRGCGLPRNYFGDKNMYLRAVAMKSTDNGTVWSDRKLLYASNIITPGIDDQSVIASPSFIEDKGKYYCYDLVYSTQKNNYKAQKNQTSGFVFRREADSPDSSFGAYTEDKICGFENRPWGDANDPWHLEVVKYDNTFFMLITAGLVGKSNGDSLWLAYSKDGMNFKVIEKPLFTNDTYKSSIVPTASTADKLEFMVYQSKKSDGTINVYRLAIDKI